MTTFDTTTPPERAAEVTAWKVAALRSHIQDMSEQRAIDLVTGRVRLIHGGRDCPVRLALAGVMVWFDGEGTEECGCGKEASS